MQISFSSEVYMLAYQLDRLARKHRRSWDFTFMLKALHEAKVHTS